MLPTTIAMPMSTIVSVSIGRTPLAAVSAIHDPAACCTVTHGFGSLRGPPDKDAESGREGDTDASRLRTAHKPRQYLCYVYASLSRLDFRGLCEKGNVVFEGFIGFPTVKKPTALMMHW